MVIPAAASFYNISFDTFDENLSTDKKNGGSLSLLDQSRLMDDHIDSADWDLRKEPSENGYFSQLCASLTSNL